MAKLKINLSCVRVGLKLSSPQIVSIFSSPENQSVFELNKELPQLIHNSFYLLNEKLECVGAIYVTGCKKKDKTFEYTCKSLNTYLTPKPTKINAETEKDTLYSFDMDTTLPKANLSLGEINFALQDFQSSDNSVLEFCGTEEKFPLYLGKFAQNNRFIFISNDSYFRVYTSDLTECTDKFLEVQEFVESLSSRPIIFTAIDAGYYLSVDDIYFNGGSCISKPYSERLGLLGELKYNNYFKKYNVLTANDYDEYKLFTELLTEIPTTAGIRKLDPDHSFLEFQQFPDKNEEFFDKFTDESCYFLGFLISDGHISDEDKRIEFRISAMDKEILKKLAVDLNKDALVEKDGYVKFRFASAYMYDRLKELGATGNKEERVTYKYIPKQHVWSFAKGVFDADGSVTPDRLQIDSANHNLLLWLQKVFNNVAETKVYNYDTYSKLVVLGDKAQEVLDKMDTSPVGLKRKSKLKKE